MKRLRRAFLVGDSPDVAPRLLNKLLVVGECVGRITEVEAYRSDDPASHTYRGRTARNAVMFGPAGHLYVYFTYGMHFCANVVTGEVDNGQAVLLRAVEPIDGVEQMRARRGRDRNVADGPAKLCQAFGIDRAMNGVDLITDEVAGLYDDGVAPPQDLAGTPRVGIRVGTDRFWRWAIVPARHVASQRIPAP
jgi:DNA-3-methyladenine glycosylase